MRKLPKWPHVLLVLSATTALVGPEIGHAADPQPYTVDLPNTDVPALDTALKASSVLVTLREKAPVGPFALITRAREDRGRLETALNSFGYYGARISIDIAGRPIDDPDLPTMLDRTTASVPVTVHIDKGPLYKLRQVQLTGDPIPVAREALKLKPGDPAVAADVLAAQDRMLTALLDSSHALAKVDKPVAVLVPSATGLDVSYDVKPGPRVDLGPITITGLDRVHESYVRRRLLLHPGEPFDPRTISKAREDLAGVGVFSAVTVDAPDHLDPAGQLPLTFRVVERKRHVLGATAAYSTDLGFSAGVTWSHRNLFGNAERLDLGAAITQLGGTASRRPGYDVSATLTQPDIFVRDLDLIYRVEGIKESLDAYDRTALLAGISLRRRFSEELSLTAGVQAQQARITQEGVTNDYTLVQLPVTAAYNTTGPEGLLDPTHGIKATGTITPSESLRSPGATFVILSATGSTYFDFGSAGRSVLALRATVASVQGATTFELPPDQRLYAGGSGTVRGYRYQSIGPKFPDLRPIGGTSLGAGTVEFRQRFLSSFGAAVFVDAGEVSTSSAPFTGDLRVGAGAGLRYYTPFGPIRADFAVPLNKQRGDDSFEIYVGIGQAF
ncbi:MAG: autotransporter assembly complex family protein [Acetobacteraceae bacterium]|nr:autotransporter assembly complex family protein [Acetobacteraceae bacterium]